MPVSSLLISSMAGGGGGGAAQGIANIGSGLISGVAGLFQRRKAKKLLSGLQQPLYSIPEEVLQNQRMAQINANQGLPSEQYNAAVQQINQREANALYAAKDRRSALMALPQIQRQGNEAATNLNVQSAVMRRQNQNQLYNVNNQVAGYRDKMFNINQMQPYQRNYNYAMGLLGAGNQNLMSGLDKLVAGGGQIASGMTRKKRYSADDSGSGDAAYYNGYGSGSNYGGFETGY